MADSVESTSSFTNDLDPALLDLVQHLAGRPNRDDDLRLRELEAWSPSEADQIRRLLPTLTLLAELSENWSHRDAVLDTPEPGLGELGDFKLIRTIGRGGMGTVYEAVQRSLNRRVAVKVLPTSSMLDPRKLKRFEIEAKATAQLHHTNIVPVYAVGCERGSPYYAMQLIEGRSVAEFIRDARTREGLATDDEDRPTADELDHQLRRADRFLPETRETALHESIDGGPAVEEDLTFRSQTDYVGSTTGATFRNRSYFQTLATLGYQASQALEHAHQRGILHRDVKPANLLLDALGTVWVTDFGLARFRNGDDLTCSGDLLGTLRYMSPEQARGTRETIDGRTDVYSLGITLYELLTLRPAFGARDRQMLLNQILNEEPIAPSRIAAGVPADLETIILKAIAKSPADRYMTAQLMSDDLRRYLDDKPILARRPGITERLARRARRNVTLLLVMAAMLVVSLTLLTSVVLLFNAKLLQANDDLRRIGERERFIRKDAQHQRMLAEVQTRLSGRYHQANRLRLASREWELGRIEEAQTILGDLAQGAAKTESFGFPGLYLNTVIHQQVHQLWGHAAMPSAVTYSGDRGRLATGDYDGTILIWDLPSQHPTARLKGFQGRIEQLNLSHDGRMLLSSCVVENHGPVFQIWDVHEARLVGQLRLTHGSSGRYQVSADFRHLAFLATRAAGHSELQIWRIPGPHEGPRESFARLKVLRDVDEFAFSPWGGAFAALEGGGLLRIHSVRDTHPPRVVSEKMRDLSALNFDSTGRTLWACLQDSSLISWDVSTGSPSAIQMRIGEVARNAALFALIPQGHPLAIFQDESGTILVTNLRDGHTRKLAGTLTTESMMAISGDGRWLAFAGGSRPARIWDMASDEEPLTYEGKTGDVHGLEFVEGDPELAIASEHPAVRLWHPQAEPDRSPIARHDPEAWAVVLSPDGSTIYSGGDDHLIRAWDVRSRSEVRRFSGHDTLITSLTLNRAGTILVSGDYAGTVRLWGLNGGSLRSVLRGHHGPVRAVVLSRDGRRLVSGGTDATIRIWEFPSGRPIRQLHGHTNTIRTLAISPDGKTLASGGNDGMLRLWDLDSGKPLARTRGAHQILCVAFSPDGGTIAASRNDGAVLICNSRKLESGVTLRGNVGEVRSLAFSPDGYTLATGGADTVVKLWDTRTSQDVLCLKGHQGTVTSLAFSADSQSLVSAALTGEIYRWSVDDLSHLHDPGFDEPEARR